jgi:hypothetical protein
MSKENSLKYISPITGKPCKTRPSKLLAETRRRVRIYNRYLKQIKQWRIQHPNYSSQYKKDNPERNRSPNRKYNKTHPEILKAHNDSRHLNKKDFCEKCGAASNLEKHHPDYSKPLEIVTLCRKCHIEATYYG